MTTFPLDEFKFLSDVSGNKSANEILVRHKEIIISNNWCTNIIPGETADDLPEFRRIPKESHITDYSKAESTVQPATLRYSSTSQFVIHFVAFHYDMMAWNEFIAVFCFLEGFTGKQ